MRSTSPSALSKSSTSTKSLYGECLTCKSPVACPSMSMSSATLAFSATWPISSESTGGRSDPRPGSPGHGLLCTQEVCRCQRFNRSRRFRASAAPFLRPKCGMLHTLHRSILTIIYLQRSRRWPSPFSIHFTTIGTAVASN